MRLLCVCSGNTCRSPMLQTLLRAALATAGRTDVEVGSAGTGAGDGEPASEGGQRAMARRNLSLADHASRHIANVDLATIDHVYCMTSAHAAAVRGRGVPANKISVINAAHGGVPDPWGGDDRAYEACAVVLAEAATQIAKELP